MVPLSAVEEAAAASSLGPPPPLFVAGFPIGVGAITAALFRAMMTMESVLGKQT